MTHSETPDPAQRRYLRRGLNQPGYKLPLFDEDGQQIPEQTIRACMKHGWAAPWYRNPLKPDWLVCRLTEAGRLVINTSDALDGVDGEAEIGAEDLDPVT